MNMATPSCPSASYVLEKMKNKLNPKTFSYLKIHVP